MLNRSAEYALRAAHLLAHGAPEGRTTSAELAQALDLPANFLSKLLNRLRQEGVLTSRRGPQGGFRLARPPDEVTLADVIRPFDDVVQDRQCILGHPECRDDTPCAAHERWRDLADRVERFFRETTLEDLGPGSGIEEDFGGRDAAAGGARADRTPPREESA